MGISPSIVVAPPMMSNVVMNVFLRPTRSPILPNTMAPIERTTKPVPKDAVWAILDHRAGMVGLRDPFLTEHSRYPRRAVR
nr:hypothetical protein GCM10017611_60710 [Rhodococcus wratislaviensis]